MMKDSLLSEITRRRGADFQEYHGWRVAAQFQPLDQEYSQVTERAAICDLSHRRKLRITGGDQGADFLNRLTTNEVMSLRTGQGMLNLLLTEHGKLLADMRVFRTGEDLLLDFDPLCFDAACEVLSKHRLSTEYDLVVEDWIATVGVLGPGSAALLSSLSGAPISLEAPMDHALLDLGGFEIRVILSDYYGVHSFELWASRESLTRIISRIEESTGPEAVSWVGWRVLNVLRIEAGIPWYGVDMDESNFPQEVLMERAISYTKGCFLGQETVARIKYRGHVNRHLAGLRFEDSALPVAGNKIRNAGRQVGSVTSAVRSPGLNQVIGLGFVRRGFDRPGTRLETLTSSATVSTEVVTLPFLER